MKRAKADKRNMQADYSATFKEHLEELRKRILKSTGIILFIAGITFFVSPEILQIIAKPIGQLVFISPQESFIAHVLISLWCSIFFSSPFIFYQIWQFISKGLTEKEKRMILTYGPISFALFLLGSFFGYFIIVPIGLKFLLGFSSSTLIPMISIHKYVSFVGMLTLNFGIVFELPLGILFLTKANMITPEDLSKKRRHAIVLFFVLAAVFTPPDIVTQSLMALPLVVLYELGIFFSRAGKKRDE